MATRNGWFATACGGLVVMLALAPAGYAQEQPEDNSANRRRDRREVRRNKIEIDNKTQMAIRRGLDFLSRRQESNGAYVDGIGRKVNNTYLAHPGQHVGVTALAGMAFLSAFGSRSAAQ